MTLDVFGFACDILIAGFNDLGREHGYTVDRLLEMFREANLKLKKRKCHFRCTNIPFFGDIISWDGSSPEPRKVKAHTYICQYSNARKSSNHFQAQ